MLLTNRRYSKSNPSVYLDPGNTTSTSLKKYSSSHEEHNNTVRTSSFIDKKGKDTLEERNFDEDSASIRVPHKEPDMGSPKKPILKSFKKKNLDYKSTQYSAVSTNLPTLPPFNDP